jgi:hypothetical protein
MAAGGSRYYQSTAIRRQDPDAVNRGLQVGAEVGKLLGGLAGAIKGAQKDAIANRLMDEQSLAGQQGAPGVAQDLGTLPSDDGSTSAATDNAQTPTTQDLGTLPQRNAAPSLGINPDIAATSTDTSDAVGDTDLAQAIAAAKLGGGPTVGSAAPPTSTTTTQAAPLSSSGDFTLNASDYAGAGPKALGSTIHTGGVQELDLQKEILAQQMQKQEMASSKARAADLLAEQQGTGRFAIDAATKRAQLANIQSEMRARDTKPKAGEKNPPAVNVDSEPVIDQNQLNGHINKIYGPNAAEGMASTLNEPQTMVDPDTKMTVPNPNAPVVTGTTVTVGPKNKRVTMPLEEAKVYAKQANALRIRNGLPVYPVPGETDTTLGTKLNPYPTRNNLDVAARPPGSWVILPNKKIAQVPERR